jgi:hypothetical protein
MLFLEISIVVTVLLCIYWVLKGDKSELNGPYPIYNSAPEIGLIETDDLLDGSCDHYSFWGEKVEAFFAQGFGNDILDFYRQVAKENHMTEMEGDYAVQDKANNIFHFTGLCFRGIYKSVQTANFAPIFDMKIQPVNTELSSNNAPLNDPNTASANMVAIIDINHSDIIQRFAKNIPPEASYFVVLLQGYIHYE